jgi:hypothetical protein
MNEAQSKLKEMMPVLLLARASKPRLQELFDNLEVWGAPIQQQYLDIFADIELHEYREVIEIRGLLTEELWQRYKDLGLEDMREQLLLAQALKNLKTILKAKVLKDDEEETHRRKKDSRPPIRICVQSQ